MVLTGQFHRVSLKYGAFAYRLIHMDAGVALSQLGMAARLARVHATMAPRLDDVAVNAALRLDDVPQYAQLWWRFTGLVFRPRPAAKRWRIANPRNPSPFSDCATRASLFVSIFKC